MPKLILKFGDRVIHEYGIDRDVTIGRLPDNAIIIDNPAVSGHHARIVRDGENFVLEDLHSKNGTYVNEQHVVRAALQDGDVVLIGKHKIVFDQAETADATDADAEVTDGAPAPTMGATTYLDTKDHRALLARLREARAARERAAAASTASGKAPDGSAIEEPGVLRRLAEGGRDAEYRLEAHTSLIGKSQGALVRLRGWFKPAVAAAVVREGSQYFVTPTAGETRVNGERLDSRRELLDGDVLEVSGLLLEFRRSGQSRRDEPHPNVA